jgi:N-acetylglucosaminyl-diphospho-decaprenol L-rhamnosyltransferase
MPDRDAAEAALIVVNYETPELVDRLLQTVGPARGKLRLEVVIVDNGSRDESPRRIRASHPEAHVIEAGENRGFAASVNIGFAATAAPVVFVLNADTELRPGALALLFDALGRHPRAGVAAPLLLNPDGSLQRNAYRRLPSLITLFVDFCLPIGHALEHVQFLHPHVLPARRIRRGGEVAHVSGAAVAIRREAYLAAGPFDERFFLYLEETEWQARVVKAGWTIEVAPAAEVVHLVRGGGEAAESFSPHYLRSAYLYFALRGRPATLVDLILLTASALSRMALVPIGLMPGNAARASRQTRSFRALSAAVRARRRSGALP